METNEKRGALLSSRLALLVLGATAIVAQTILLREFMSVFQGNELVVGIVLAGWMLLTGGGAVIGGRFASASAGQSLPLILLLLLGIVPTLCAILVTVARILLFPPGAMGGIGEVVLLSLIALSPVCLLVGCSFPLWAARAGVGSSPDRIVRTYSSESLGSVLGGLVFGALLLAAVPTFILLSLLSTVTLLVTSVVAWRMNRRLLSACIMAIGLVMLVVPSVLGLDRVMRQLLLRDQHLIAFYDTPYGKLSVTAKAEQISVFENDVLLASSNDPVSTEEAVHFAMVQHPSPRTVLLVGGELSALAPEVFKYGTTQVISVERNPWLFDVSRRFFSGPSDPRVRTIAADARQVVNELETPVDLVLVNLPDPSTAQINRYYTVEFLRELRRHLRPGAVVGWSVTSSGEYESPEARHVYSILFNTLRSCFTNVLCLPASRTFFLASDSALTPNVAARVAERGVPTRYVDRDYIDDASLARRSGKFQAGLDPHAPTNLDFMPIAYAQQLALWASMFGFNPWWIAAGVITAALAFAVRLDRVTVGIFTGGFAAASLEFLILLSFQILSGYVFAAMGLIIAVFMAGMAAGAYAGRTRPSDSRRWYAGIQFMLAALAFGLVPAFTLLPRFGGVVVYGTIVGAAFIVGMLVGWEFALAVRISRGPTAAVAASLYSIDLVGSALGALLASAFLVPAWGLAGVGYLVGGMMLLSGVAALRAERTQQT